MTDRGRENKRERERHRLRGVRKLSGDEYAKLIVKVVVAQVCENQGFQSFPLSALDTLSDVTIRYMCDVGKTAILYANSAGRTEVNHFDIIQGLEDLSVAQGFAGASEVDHCLAHSGVVREISQYVSDYEEVPFTHDLRRFPVDRERNQPQSFLQIGEDTPEGHIPGWLPTFPDPKTYNLSLKESGEVGGFHDQDVNLQFAKHEDRSQSRLPLPNMPQLISSNRFPGSSSSDARNPANPKETVPWNPYLSAPIRVVEKEASPSPVATTLPKKPLGHASEGNVPHMNNQNADSNIFVLKILAPESANPSEQQFLWKQRTPVHFKFKICKKSLVIGRMPRGSFLEAISQCTDSSSGEHNLNNYMKERARKILKESMESQPDVA